MKLRMYEKGNPLGRGLLPAGLPELTGNRKPAGKNICFIQQDQMNPPEKTEQVFFSIRKLERGDANERTIKKR